MLFCGEPLVTETQLEPPSADLKIPSLPPPPSRSFRSTVKFGEMAITPTVAVSVGAPTEVNDWPPLVDFVMAFWAVARYNVWSFA